jgi:hypothetical protein
MGLERQKGEQVQTRDCSMKSCQGEEQSRVSGWPRLVNSNQRADVLSNLTACHNSAFDRGSRGS